MELFFHHADLSTQTAAAPERFRGLEKGQRSREQVVRYEPPRLLTWTWGATSKEPSEVTFELTPQGDKVLLVLTHRRLANKTLTEGIAVGWHTHLEILGERLNGREPRAFWTIFGEFDGVYEKRFASE